MCVSIGISLYNDYLHILTTIKTMKKLLLVISFLAEGLMANELPDLGGYSDNIISKVEEDRIAKQILFQVNQSPSVLHDVEIDDFLMGLGNRLLGVTSIANRDIDFFIVNDSTINAFAMLGGIIGVHTGLFLAANSESELASVLAHEISHITQKHLQRMIASQQNDSLKTVLGVALALLISRSNPELASGTIRAAGAAAAQNALDFTRENEKEADREGIKILDRSGFDVSASIDFFKTLQRGGQFTVGASPAFLRTHPVTLDRISDIQDRLKDYPYKQRVDSDEFYYVKGKLRALLEEKSNIISILQMNIKNKSYINEAGERFSLAYAYLLNSQIIKAREQLDFLKGNKLPNPMLINLEAIILVKERRYIEAIKLYKKGLLMYPGYRAFVYGLADHYIHERKEKVAINMLQKYLLLYPKDPSLYELMAKAHAGEGKVLLQYENLSNAFYYRYNIREAISLMDLAVRANDGNFYEKSRVEARLKELQREEMLFKEI
jgi:beta-barrel assembly-enhancing protease